MRRIKYFLWQYRRIFLRFISQIIFWASWITSFSVLTFPNLVFSIFIWLPLVEYLIPRILVIYFIQIFCEIPYKIQNLFDIWRHFERLRVFFIFWKKKLFLSPYCRMCQYRRNFLAKKHSAVLGPLHLVASSRYYLECTRVD